ncbi:MAG TPA: immunoglobulin domain-containing protein [Verrucomicrobiae bacterium]
MAAFGASLTLAWNPNTTQPVAGYSVYSGTSSGHYTAIANAKTKTTYNLTGLLTGRTYYLAIRSYDSNGVPGASSPEIVASVDSVPVIVGQPISQSAADGSIVVLSANATSSFSFSYQWMLNGVAIDGATNAQLALTGVGQQSAGSYTVIASNSAGTTASQAAVLNVAGVGGSAFPLGPPPTPGLYEGLYYQLDANGNAMIVPGTSGWIKLTLNPGGSYSCRVVPASGASYSFTGRTNSNGDAVYSISQGLGLDTLNMVIHLASASVNGQITGVVSNTSLLTSWVSMLSAVLTTNSVAVAANYTFLSPVPPGAIPTNVTWSVGISTNGGDLIAGTLGDGAVFWQSEFIGVNNSTPVYCFPYGASGGLLAGWIGIANGVPVGNLTWIRPSGLPLLGGFAGIIGLGGGGPLNFMQLLP